MSTLPFSLGKCPRNRGNSRTTGAAHSGKVGRIYRDVRFFKDKSPYSTHVRAYWTQATGGGPGWLLHTDAAGARLMTGLHALDPEGLARYRAAVDRDGEALQRAIDRARDTGADPIFGDTAPSGPNLVLEEALVGRRPDLGHHWK